MIDASVVLAQVLVRSRLVVGGRGRRCGAAGGRTDSSASRPSGPIFVSYSTVVQRHVVVDDVVGRIRSADRRPADRLRDVRVVRYDVLQFGHALAVSADLRQRRVVSGLVLEGQRASVVRGIDGSIRSICSDRPVSIGEH